MLVLVVVADLVLLDILIDGFFDFFLMVSVLGFCEREEDSDDMDETDDPEATRF